MALSLILIRDQYESHRTRPALPAFRHQGLPKKGYGHSFSGVKTGMLYSGVGADSEWTEQGENEAFLGVKRPIQITLSVCRSPVIIIFLGASNRSSKLLSPSIPNKKGWRQILHSLLHRPAGHSSPPSGPLLTAQRAPSHVILCWPGTIRSRYVSRDCHTLVATLPDEDWLER